MAYTVLTVLCMSAAVAGAKLPAESLLFPSLPLNNDEDEAVELEPTFHAGADPPKEEPILAAPSLAKCSWSRVSDDYTVVDGVPYYVSTTNPEHKVKDLLTNETFDAAYTWLQARNFCRERCLETVSVETYEQFQRLLHIIAAKNLTAIWTSGRRCDFEACRSVSHLHPVNIKGWFWGGSLESLPRTDRVPEGWPLQPWSSTGDMNLPQPDNAEVTFGHKESCLAVLNDHYGDGVKFHDVACYHKKAFVCERSRELEVYVEKKNGAKLPSIRVSNQR